MKRFYKDLVIVCTFGLVSGAIFNSLVVTYVIAAPFLAWTVFRDTRDILNAEDD